MEKKLLSERYVNLLAIIVALFTVIFLILNNYLMKWKVKYAMHFKMQ